MIQSTFLYCLKFANSETKESIFLKLVTIGVPISLLSSVLNLFRISRVYFPCARKISLSCYQTLMLESNASTWYPSFQILTLGLACNLQSVSLHLLEWDLPHTTPKWGAHIQPTRSIAWDLPRSWWSLRLLSTVNPSISGLGLLFESI